MTTPADNRGIASGLAALSICESLMLAMGDLKILSEKDAIGVISDAASAHRGAGESTEDIALHSDVAALLERIISGGNSIRRP